MDFLNQEEIEAAKKYVEELTQCKSWRDGFLVADGTAINLAEKPGLFDELFYGKDKTYAINLQAVVNVKTLQIVDYAVGPPGSVHDATAFKETWLSDSHNSLLSPDEWIWADSAYTLAHWVLTPFKRPPGGSLTPEQKRFNLWLSKIRIAVEHAIGLLKGCLESLKELRIRISNEDNCKWANRWIQSCIVVHK
ncbi:uncharacterized protein FIBRA_06974 [Fibroporia radiculosa]|uniref:DDE Tnp4 domain-containing protein n=1 Tax=Fibroporia radiculosa TaxID=599839 RepID=J4GD19_9APHY|nr:uncharacterized protein FIBRA_06974 [Fibroporia radiculosa]CCM04783.1 predicted protein [Fibroporia radiculosa]